jgi:capsular polysaccharide biosynthesis protein
MKSVTIVATLVASLVTYYVKADEYTDQQQLQVLQQIQQTQQFEQMQEYGRQATEDYENQMPEARGRAIREKYMERQAYEQAITSGE